MPDRPSSKDRAWSVFDRIVREAAPDGNHTNPWVQVADGGLRYEPDFDTLTRLLAVPLQLRATSRTGVPALALDVWLSYEFRRAGFHADAVWPRAEHPRILPMPVANLLRRLPRRDRDELAGRLRGSKAIAGVTSSSAAVLGKNYVKQVDVVMSDWSSGPELLISTKRMDSSYGKNAANRVEESYGDAKNLRLRHPLAALGFVFGLRSDILDREPDIAEWLIDLLSKLGREDDAYHATCLVMIEYDDAIAVPVDSGEGPELELVAAGIEADPEIGEERPFVPNGDVDRLLAELPAVHIRHDAVPDELAPARFLAALVDRVLDTAPVNFHKEARIRRKRPRSTS